MGLFEPLYNRPRNIIACTDIRWAPWVLMGLGLTPIVAMRTTGPLLSSYVIYHFKHFSHNFLLFFCIVFHSIVRNVKEF